MMCDQIAAQCGTGASATAGGGKKAGHVKWAGKTIALGTFPAAEADSKCAQAKALTRAWRSTMQPKPSREWVMLELERLGVRIVNGRKGAASSGQDGIEKAEVGEPKGAIISSSSAMAGLADPSILLQQQQQQENLMRNNSNRLHSLMGGGAGGSRQEAALASMFSPSDLSGAFGNPSNSIEFLAGTGADRASSLGLSMLSDEQKNGSLNLGVDSLGSAGGGLEKNGGTPTIPPHRPMVGGGAAAAYEAAREDHYKNLALREARKQQQQQQQQQKQNRVPEPRNLQGQLGGLSSTHSQHYEMLKLHHMNLLKEIQETTLMMNVYQQQQEQQQRQQQQADALLGRNCDQMMPLHQRQGMGNESRMASLGFQNIMDPGGVGSSNTPNSIQALLQQQQQQQQLISNMRSNNNNQLSNLRDGGGGQNHDFSLSFGDNLRDINLQQKIRSLTDDIMTSASHKQGATDSGSSKKNKLDDEGKDTSTSHNQKRVKVEGGQTDWM